MCCSREGPVKQGSSAPEAVPVARFDFSDPDVVMLVTGGTNGMLEVCNCSGPMPGGLARRSGLILSYRRAFKQTLALDTGDVFWVEPADMRNRFVLRGYRALGYDAVAMGDQEWALPDPLLRECLQYGPTAYLSTGVRAKTSSIEIERVIKREWDTCRLAVVNHVTSDAFIFFDSRRKTELEIDDVSELEKLTARLDRDGWLVVVIVHGSNEDLRADVDRLAGDLYIRGHTRQSRKKLYRVQGKPVVQVGGPDYVAAVAVSSDNRGQIANIDYRLELVDNRWPPDRRMLEIYQAYAHAAMRQALDANRTRGLDFVPSSTCGTCHTAQYKTWKRSKHAHAWRSLQDVGRTIDPNCVMCHTLGFMKQGGFFTYEKTPELAGVHCQNCHRFNADHEKKEFTAPVVNAAVCQTCHTLVTDPFFKQRKKSRFTTMGCGTSRR